MVTEEVRIEDCESDRSSEKSRKFSLKNFTKSFRNSNEIKPQKDVRKQKKFSIAKIFYLRKKTTFASGYGEYFFAK